MRFVFPRLLIQTLEDFICVCVYIEIHLLVVVLQQIRWISVQQIVDLVVTL